MSLFKNVLINKLYVAFLLFFAVCITFYYAVKVALQSLFSINKNRYRKNAARWSSAILRIFSVSVESVGIEKLDKGSTYIFASNHSSLFDIPILFYSLRKLNYIIIYKKELEKIPIFGWSLKVSPFISIDRAVGRNAMASIEKTLEQMKDNDCPIIFPEGTRSQDGKLQDFKRGAFLIASRSSRPIVPITIIGSSKILPKGSLAVKSKNAVKVIISNPIKNKVINNRMAENELMEKVHDIIMVTLEENL
jgi:1-acyl-sn-glycerol-3-phosphate acyltransferase